MEQIGSPSHPSLTCAVDFPQVEERCEPANSRNKAADTKEPETSVLSSVRTPFLLTPSGNAETLAGRGGGGGGGGGGE